MDHSKFNALIQKEEFISSFKSSANYYIQQQSLNYIIIYDETPNLVNFVLLSVTELYSQQIMQDHAESTPVMESFYEVYF